MLLLLLLPLTALAQTISDSQVLELVRREASAGSSRSQIVTKLMQRGVKVDQIRRVRALYEKQLRSRTTGDKDGEPLMESGSRLRINNSVLPESEDSLQTDTLVAEKKIFGHDIFNNKLLSFEPNMNIATPEDYVLGAGDVLVIDVYGASQKSWQLTVSPEGTVTVPDYGPVNVAGMTVAAANSRLRSSLGSRYSSSSMKLSVGQTRTILVNVMGEVRSPGTYHLSAFASVFHALYAAGGINELGTLRNIRVLRGGRLVTVVDVYEFILNGRLAGNIRLKEGDVVQVGAYDCLVSVEGNVKRPMFYEMREAESVSTLLRYAGGFTGDAYRKNVQLVRSTGGRYSVYTVDEFEQTTFKVADGDVVTVEGVLDRYDNMVEVRGAVGGGERSSVTSWSVSAWWSGDYRAQSYREGRRVDGRCLYGPWCIAPSAC